MNNRNIKHICLISPQRAPWSKTPKIRNVLEGSNRFLKAWHSPNLSILTIAGLTPPDIKITYIDEDFEKIDYNINYDLVGISAMTQQIMRGYEIATEFKKRNIYVVLGGIHASVLPEEALNYVDTVIVGEAENLWPQFINDFKKNKQNKIYKEYSVVDLTKSPMPRYDILKEKNYFKDPRYFYNMVPIQVTRGCPHACEFCLVTKIYGSKFRKKTIDQLKVEINEIKNYFSGKILMFADDNLFLDRKFSKELLKQLKELKVRWVAQSDIAIGEDNELLSLIYESGGLFLLIGFESINPENLKGMNKNSWKYRQLKNYSKYIENIQKHGIIVFGAFIFGLDNDDTNVFGNIVKFMDSHNITGQLTIATPLPGSIMIERLREENRLLKKEPFWNDCTFFDVLYKPKKMSVAELEEGFIWAYKQVFNEVNFTNRAKYLKTIYKKLE